MTSAKRYRLLRYRVYYIILLLSWMRVFFLPYIESCSAAAAGRYFILFYSSTKNRKLKNNERKNYLDNLFPTTSSRVYYHTLYKIYKTLVYHYYHRCEVSHAFGLMTYKVVSEKSLVPARPSGPTRSTRIILLS